MIRLRKRGRERRRTDNVKKERNKKNDEKGWGRTKRGRGEKGKRRGLIKK